MIARVPAPFHHFLSRKLLAGLLILTATACSTYDPLSAPNAGEHLDIEYTIEGDAVKLSGGFAETAVAGSSTRLVTRYWGNELHHDIDGDGLQDIVFLLTRETGGSGTFYFVVAALQRPKGWVGTKGIFLGDRIAPQPIEPGVGNRLTVNFADRALSEPYTTPPSHGRSLRLRLNLSAMDFVIESEG